MRKSANMITDDAVKFVTGIENIEVFLKENDEWQFHFSKVTDIHWNSEKRQLDVTIPLVMGTGTWVWVPVFHGNFFAIFLMVS